MRVGFVAALALAASAAPAFAESYNIVCPVAALGTEQAAGATIAKGYIFSLDLDAKQACQRVDNRCAPQAFTLEGGVAELAAKDAQSVTFNTETNELTVVLEGGAVNGTCRRAPFTSF